MSKVSVFVEEHLVRELTFDVQDEDADARMIKAEKLAREQIKAGEVVLTANDFSGTHGCLWCRTTSQILRRIGLIFKERGRRNN